MARLDLYTQLPSGMQEYLSYYGWHFSKKMYQWAVSRMYREENGRKKPVEPYTKERVDGLLRQYNLVLTRDSGYDSAYVANMCLADYYGTSVKGEGALIQYVYDTVEDPDGYDGMIFTRFYADCIGSGTPISWEDMI